MDLTIDEEEEKKLAIMKKLTFFQGFSDNEMIALLKSSSWMKKTRGDIIFRTGDTDKNLYIVLKGEVRVQKIVGFGGKKSTVGALTAGECFGEMSLITGEPRSADVVCSEDGFFLRIDAETLGNDTDIGVLQSLQTKFYRYFCNILAQRLNKLSDKYVKSQVFY